MVLKPSLICFVFRDHFGRAENAPVRCPMRAGPAPTFPQTSELYPCSGQRERGARDERRRRDSRMRSNSHYPHHRDSESRDQNAMPLSVRRKRFWPYAQYSRDPAATECLFAVEFCVKASVASRQLQSRSATHADRATANREFLPGQAAQERY